MDEETNYPARLTPAYGLTLSPPWESEFTVYGDDDTLKRAIDWAAENRYLHASGLSKCAHGFVGLGSCPGDCSSFDAFDHADIWVSDRPDERGRTFLLAHPYYFREDKIQDYARAWGLGYQSGPMVTTRDGWYHNYIPGGRTVRLNLPNDGPLWPVEQRAIQLLIDQPVVWDDYL